MNAIVYTKYGGPEQLTLTDVPKPAPKPNEVLIAVKAAGLNSWDWDMLRGKPYIVRMWGLRKPGLPILGADVAGVVEAIGDKVTRFKPGDAVFGDTSAVGWGGFAEYVCTHEKALERKPDHITFEEAAAIPQAGVMALQCFKGIEQVKPGNHVLINGAGGGVGTFAIQLARNYGMEVTAVDRADKFDLLESLGANHLIDYQKQLFIDSPIQYDLIIDVIARNSLSKYKAILNHNGRLFIVGGSAKPLIQAMFLGPVLSARGSKKLGILTHEPNKDLLYLTNLFKEKQIKPIIDTCYALEDTAKAFRHIGEGNTRGKVVVKVN